MVLVEKKKQLKCRTGKALEELEETHWLLSATVGSGCRALHLHMKATCMEMGTDGSMDDGYEGDG